MPKDGTRLMFAKTDPGVSFVGVLDCDPKPAMVLEGFGAVFVAMMLEDGARLVPANTADFGENALLVLAPGGTSIPFTAKVAVVD